MTLSRRRFLQLSAGASAFNIVPSRVLGRAAPSNKIVLGMIGAGGMGLANMESFLSLDDVVVKAVCDVSACKRLSAKALANAHSGTRDCEAFSDFHELCARPDIDAVMIAAPDFLHARIGLEALRCGKDVYGETPFAHTRAEGLSLSQAVTQRGRVWQSGNGQRVEPRFRRAVAAVRAGVLGPVARVEVGLPGGGRGPACARGDCGVGDFHWRWVSAWGGGTLADGIGLYGDTALWGAGRDAEPARVEGCGVYPQDGLYDTATAFRFRCAYPDGMELTVADGGRLEKGIGVRWIGRNGRWVWVTNGALEACDSALLAEVAAWPLEPCAGLFRNFIDCVKTREGTIAPAEPARLAAALAQLGDRAMRGC